MESISWELRYPKNEGKTSVNIFPRIPDYTDPSSLDRCCSLPNVACEKRHCELRSTVDEVTSAMEGQTRDWSEINP
jgi:hypothetical protein